MPPWIFGVSRAELEELWVRGATNGYARPGEEQVRTVLDALESSRGLTAVDVAARTGLGSHEALRALNYIHHLGEIQRHPVEDGPPLWCRRNGSD